MQTERWDRLVYAWRQEDSALSDRAPDLSYPAEPLTSCEMWGKSCTLSGCHQQNEMIEPDDKDLRSPPVSTFSKSDSKALHSPSSGEGSSHHLMQTSSISSLWWS